MTQLPLFPDDKSKLEAAFWVFHKSHPEVYEKLVQLAREWRTKHVRRIGIATVFETARYTLDIERSDDDGFKLNNNHRAYYSRLIMRDEKDLAGVFSLRQQRIESSLEQ